jgi:uncharacterized protein (TIGR01244 family)
MSAGLALVMLLSSGCAVPGGEIPRSGVENFHEVDARLYRSAQPTVDGIATLATRGVKTVINLRLADDVLPEEESAVRNRGMTYRNVPFAGMSRPTFEQVKTVLALIESATPPVLVHCERGADRTGTIVACYRIRYQKWTAERALDEASQNGMAWIEFGMKAFVRDFARSEKDAENAAPIGKSSELRRAIENNLIR